MIESLSIAVHAFVSRVSMSFPVDENSNLFRIYFKCSEKQIIPAKCFHKTFIFIFLKAFFWGGVKYHIVETEVINY